MLTLGDLQQFVRPISQRVRLMVSRALGKLVDDALGRQSVQVTMLMDGPMSDIEHFQQYGFTAHPHPGAEGIFLSVGGQRQAGVVICVEDRQYRLKGLQEGEVALYDDLGQVVHLTRSGPVIQSSLPMTVSVQSLKVTAPDGIEFDTPLLKVSGDILDQTGGDGGQTMAAMRSTYDGHSHEVKNVEGGNATITSEVPNQQMVE